MESNEPENPTPPPEPPPPKPRMSRSSSDRVIGGVAGGIARHYGIDATLVRVGFVAGVLLWGASILLYIAALIVMPEDPAEGDGTSRPLVSIPSFEGRNRTLAAIGVVVAVLIAGPIALGLTLAAGAIALPFAMLILLGLAVAWMVTGNRPQGDARDVLRLTLLGLGVLGLLFVLAVGSFWGSAAGGDTVVAAVVIASGVALVASAFAKPARWLILPALAIAIPAGLVAAADVDLDGGVGEKDYRPATAADIRDKYEIGAGSLRLDLRAVDLPAGERTVKLEVGMGEAVVIVPEDVCVSTTANLGAGGIQVFDRDTGGIDFDWEDINSAPAGTPRLLLDADVGFGALKVGTSDSESGRFGRWHDPDERGRNLACEGNA